MIKIVPTFTFSLFFPTQNRFLGSKKNSKIPEVLQIEGFGCGTNVVPVWSRNGFVYIVTKNEKKSKNNNFWGLKKTQNVLKCYK